MSPQRICLSVIGTTGAGKSALCQQFGQGGFLEYYNPTETFSWNKEVVIDNQIFLLYFQEIGRPFYFDQEESVRTSEGVICIYSITSQQSFETTKWLRDRVVKTKGSESFPMVLVGNKSDLDHEREVSLVEGRSTARFYGCPFFESSARTRENVDLIFEEIVREIRKRSFVKKRTKFPFLRF